MSAYLSVNIKKDKEGYFMELKELTELINAVSKSSLSEFTLEEGNLKLTLKAERIQQVTVASDPTVIAKVESVAVQSPALCENKSGHEVKSPLVGTYYNAPSPDADPFVQVGDSVTKGQTLAIIEAMKLMNEIECEQDGIIKEILVENESIVEYGQPLFIIE